ncbi:hypothetical protein MUK42_27905 [Musa troglodytarum]|uniref:SWIB complex BAF60b domain-containing protein n=1 Tax=Musa troglodytarum TaxID=320322 RepID=A0A9E7F567_9LILI|nr:hypothetical protein MUK42_27905 [Musa troglodytarum]
MVSDAELVEWLRGFLRASDLSTTITTAVRRRLEDDFGVDLSGKMAFVRQLVNLFLGRPQGQQGGRGDPGEGGGPGSALIHILNMSFCVIDVRSNKLSDEVRKQGGDFTKLCSLSPLLQDFVGELELARTEVNTTFCTVMVSLGCPVTPVKPEQNNKKPKKEREGKQQKGGSSGLLVPLPLSDDLMKFFGTGENTLSRSEAVKRMWEYIKQNNLQDPADKRNVICDEKLRELLKVDSFYGFTVSKLLAPHFIKANQ